MEEQKNENLTKEELEQKREKILKETMLSLTDDISKHLDKALETKNMEQCMYNLGYSAYFINRGLKDKEILQKWKDIFDKALDYAKKIEKHNYDEIIKSQQNKK